MAESPSELRAEIEKLERKHAEHPEGRYFVPLANAYRKLGDVEHAEALLRDGLRRHPDYLSAHIVLGRCLADREATLEAREEFRYVLSLDPQNLIALRTLGELATADGEPREAVRWYEELLSVDPMNEEARQALEAIRGTRSDPEVAPELRHVPETEAVVEDDGEPADAFLVLDEVAPAELPEEDPSDESAPEEVVTETIAELYARQGFHERAAAVLRVLIRRRGGDATLERRLAEVEALIAGSAIAQPAALEADSFATSFEDGFFAPEPAGDVAVEWLAAPVDEPAAAPELQNIGSYLRALIAWKPDAEPAAAPEPAPTVASLSVSASTQATPPELALAPDVDTVEESDLFPWELPAPAQPDVEPSPEPARESPSESAATPEAERDGDDGFYSFDAFLSDAPEEDPAAAREPATPSPSEPPASPAPAVAVEDDDDLESFQAWLRSLKR